VVEYASLFVIVVAALTGFPKPALAMSAVWVMLVVVRSLVRRRVPDWPPTWDERA
jgi:hypothetical protein